MEVSFIPIFFIRKITSNINIHNEINILLSNFFLICVFVFLQKEFMFLFNSIPHFCLFDRLTGIECPVCGITRAFCSISEGNIQKAYFHNSISIIIAFYFCLQIPLRIYTLLNHHKILIINRFSKKASLFILILVSVSWIYNLIKNFLFN